ncbi:hypothetical protein [Lacrimispora sp.]|uniref:hypothetical protein n=1 Tax=Lacrimispora sp. TaxID=2719234 RepID=UPI0032E408CA
MKQEDKDRKLAYLRSQKDNPTGGYRQLLIDTYNCISDLTVKSGNQYCRTSCADICNVVYGNTHHITMVDKYLYTLKQLGYISIKECQGYTQMEILKKIDF